MSITIIQLMNNYYQDSLEEKRGTNATYSTFGYFDGLSIHHASLCSEVQEFNEEINELIVKNYNAECNRRNIICYTDNEEKNKIFWENSSEALYLFVSLVRLGQVEDFYNKNSMQDIVDTINEHNDMICLYSYNHNELAVIYYSNMYYDGMTYGMDILKNVPEIKKVYTISAFKENIIKDKFDLKPETQDELVTVQFKCSVKDYRKLSEFLMELGKKINKQQEEFKNYDVLGHDDLLIEVEDVLIFDLLKCYLPDGILNHSNRNYNYCFYNIESQIIKRRWNYEQ